MNKWYEKSGEQADVVVSTRVRLARNLRDFPFASKLSKEEREKINALVSDAILNGNSVLSKRFKRIDMEKLDQTEAISLVERHLISPEFASNKEGRALLLLDDESVSIMIGEEDHIRLQVMKEGLDLKSTYEEADKIDTLLDEALSFAFDDRLGYLTQCPTNLGTGMRASMLLHLPALSESGAMNRISGSLAKLGLTLRGLYGEGSQSKGDLYQLSNQVTLGLSEEEALQNLQDISMQLIEQERSARNAMARHMEMLDMIGRSYGILLNARILSGDEFMKLISNVRLGIALGVIEGLTYDTIHALIIDAQPATLMKREGRHLPPSERDKKRAELVKERLRTI